MLFPLKLCGAWTLVYTNNHGIRINSKLNIDHNGKIELKDFENWGAKLAQIGKLNKEKTVSLTNNLLQIWENLFLPADTNRDGSVELPELQVRIFKLFKIISI